MLLAADYATESAHAAGLVLVGLHHWWILRPYIAGLKIQVLKLYLYSIATTEHSPSTHIEAFFYRLYPLLAITNKPRHRH
jgi:hypothetical protein